MNELWDVIKLSSYLGVKRSTLYALVEKKEIPHYRIGRLARFKPAEIEEWLATKKLQGPRQSEKIRRAPLTHGGPTPTAKQLVRTAIDELSRGQYNCPGKTDRIKGLRKEE